MKFLKQLSVMFLCALVMLNSSIFAATSISINLPDLTLTLMSNGKVVKKYPIAAGMPTKDTKTVTGNYSIIERTKDPIYVSVDGKQITQPGPGNPLGPRWMRVFNTYGIHGNADVASIGTFASHGCMRMYNWDILELFDRTSMGNKVAINYNTVQYHPARVNSLGAYVVYPDTYNKKTNNFNNVMKQCKEKGITISLQKQKALRNSFNRKRVSFSKNWTIFANKGFVTSDTVTVSNSVYMNVNAFCNYFNIGYHTAGKDLIKLNANNKPIVKYAYINNVAYSSLSTMLKALNIRGVKTDYNLQTVDLDLAYVKYKNRFLTNDTVVRNYRMYVGIESFATTFGIRNKLYYKNGSYYLNSKVVTGIWNNHKFYADPESLGNAIRCKGDYWSLSKFVNYI